MSQLARTSVDSTNIKCSYDKSKSHLRHHPFNPHFCKILFLRNRDQRAAVECFVVGDGDHLPLVGKPMEVDSPLVLVIPVHILLSAESKSCQADVGRILIDFLSYCSQSCLSCLVVVEISVWERGLDRGCRSWRISWRSVGLSKHIPTFLSCLAR